MGHEGAVLLILTGSWHALCLGHGLESRIGIGFTFADEPGDAVLDKRFI